MAPRNKLESGIRRSAEFGGESSNQDHRKKDKLAVAHVFGQVESGSTEGKKFQVIYDNGGRSKVMNVESEGSAVDVPPSESESKKVGMAVGRLVDTLITLNNETQERHWNKVSLESKIKIIQHTILFKERDLKSAEKQGDLEEIEILKEDIMNLKNKLSSLNSPVSPENIIKPKPSTETMIEAEKLDQELQRAEAFKKDAEEKGQQKRQEFYEKEISDLNKKLRDLMGLESQEVFSSEEKVGLEDPSNLNSEVLSEKVTTSPEPTAGVDHAEIISDEDYKEFADNGFVSESILNNLANISKNRDRELTPREQAIFAAKASEINKILGKVNISQEEVQELSSTIETNNEAKEGSVKKYIQDLGYSKEEIFDIPLEDRNRIVEEQITRNAWFGEEEAVAPTPEVLPAPEIPQQKEKTYTVEQISAGFDGGSQKVTVEVNQEGLEKIFGAQNGQVVQGSVAPAEGLDKEKLERLEQLKKLRDQRDVRQKELEEYKKREEQLSKIGWNFEKYSALTEQEKQMVVWQNLRPEQVIQEDRSNVLESKEQTDQTPFAESDIYKRREKGLLKLPQGVADYIKEEKTAVNHFVNEMFKEGKPIAHQLTREESELYDKHKEAIERAQEKKDEQDYVNSLKGVSEGAKEFLKEEKEKANINKENQKLFSALEGVYENLDKDKLIEVLKQRGLPSGGDKQKIIERLIGDDIEKKSTDFGFVNEEIKKKLNKEFNLSEKDMVLLSPEFFSLSPEKQQYLFSKLDQKIYFDAEFASKTQNEEEIKKMGFLKRLGSSFVKGQRQVALRDKMIQEIKKGGIKDYLSDVKTLNGYLLDAPELTYELNEKGRLVPYFKYVDKTSSDKKFETPKVFFNVAASRLGEIPFEWSLKSATGEQRQAYQRAYSSYTGAKESLMRAMLEEGKLKNPNINEEGEKNIRQNTLLEISKVDAQVKFGTFITQNPEMENLSANFFEKVLGAKANDFARGAMFAGAGFATKWLGRSMAVTGVGLAVSGAVGGLMSYRKKNLEYKEKELRQRYGKSGQEVQSLNKQIEDKIAQIQDARTNKSDENVLNKLNNELSVLQKTRKETVISSGVKQDINSSNVYERLEKLVGQLEKTTDKESKKKILETIKTRIFVTEEMMRDGRINFGSQKEQIVNQYKLSEMMSKAVVTVEMEGGFGEEKTKEEEVFDRFKQFIQDNAVQKFKRGEIREAVLKGVTVGVLGYEVGMGLRYAQEAGFFSGAWEVISDKGSEAVKTAKAVYQNYSSEDVPMSSPAKIPNVAESITPVETFMAGSRGAIGAIDDMQDNLKLKFGNNPPAQYKDLMAKTPDQLARDWGFYKPGEVNESAIIKKGEGFSIDSKGIVRFVGLNGTDEVYVPQGVKDVPVIESERKFFDGARTGLASAESPSIEREATYVESEPVKRPEAPNEGYVVSKELKPAGSSWFEKEVPTEFGASNMRGEWKFLKSPNGKITGINTSRAISDDVINFRKNPRNFMNIDLKDTKLTSQTESFAIKKLTSERDTIERFLTEKNILNAPNSNLTGEETAFLKDSVSTLHKEIQVKTGGAFDGKYEEPSVFGKVEKPLAPKPERILSFETDAAPKINPSVTSVSEGSDFVPNNTAKPEVSPIEESKTNPKPVETMDKLKNKVEIISLSAGEKTYSFNTENIRGQMRFIFDEKGVATNLQMPKSTVIRGLLPLETVLEDDWMSKAKQFSSDEAVGIKKIRDSATLLKEYTTILKEGGFKENSAEYNYIQKEIKVLKDEYKDVLK